MANYDTPYKPKDNSGSIFKNDKKEKDTHPDGKGSALIDGVEYWVSSWNAKSKNGMDYRNLSFTRKEDKQYQAPGVKESPKSRSGGTSRQTEEFDDSIPF